MRTLIAFWIAISSVPMSAFAQTPDETKMPKEILEQRLKLLNKIYKQKHERVIRADEDPLELVTWSRRILDAQLPLLAIDKSASPKDRMTIYEMHVERVRDVEKLCRDGAQIGKILEVIADVASYHRIEAEILLSLQKVNTAKK